MLSLLTKGNPFDENMSIPKIQIDDIVSETKKTDEKVMGFAREN